MHKREPAPRAVAACAAVLVHTCFVGAYLLCGALLALASGKAERRQVHPYKYPITLKKNKDMDKKNEFMRRAIELSEESVRTGGGPFGAVIVRGDEIIAEASNSVTIDNDPTAHAEVNCIRKATRRLGTFDLAGCDIYTSCEPCPMCLGAIYWAHLDRIFYGNDRKDAAAIGFDDDFIYQEIPLKPEQRHKTMQRLMGMEALKAFRMWEESADKTEY